jgi:hypothetical protein
VRRAGGCACNDARFRIRLTRAPGSRQQHRRQAGAALCDRLPLREAPPFCRRHGTRLGR